MFRLSTRLALLALPLSIGLWTAAATPMAQAQATTAPASELATPAAERSELDALMFFQLLLAEIELRQGNAGSAFDMLLDAGRRSRDDGTFRRAVEVALQARAGEQALQAVRAWRQTKPQSPEALRFQIQILTALGRVGEIAEPLSALLAMTSANERSAAIASLPRFLQRLPDAKAALPVMQSVLAPYLETPATRVAAKAALARVHFAAADNARALALLRQAQAHEPDAPGPALVALDMMALEPAAEDIVIQHLARADAPVPLRLAYARALTMAQRHAQAVAQFERITQLAPNEAQPWLTLGALQLELRHPKEAEAALTRYIALASAAAPAATTNPGATAATPAAAAAEDDDDDIGADAGSRTERSLSQAYLLMAAAAEQRKDFAAAEGWLAKVNDPQRVLDVQTRRAITLARQGQVAAARELIRRVPAATPQQQRARYAAEAQMLREAKDWSQAHAVLGQALQRFADDPDLLYEQAMMLEKLDRLDEMEAVLKRVISLRPSNAAAYNALGYTWAERNMRLPEAREFIQRALQLQPGDPFITDSLGWVEFRLGNLAEAERLLRQAYAARPDTEIAAHLGEVLWAKGEREEARRIWREGQARDAQNETLRETLGRLRPGL
jgi:tetratricopeptide (TPR) repeat protein